MGPAAMPAIREALCALGVEERAGISVQSVDADGVTLAGGERIAALTTICATGMRANPLARALGAVTDRLGRVPVDPFLQVEGGRRLRGRRRRSGQSRRDPRHR